MGLEEDLPQAMLGSIERKPSFPKLLL